MSAGWFAHTRAVTWLLVGSIWRGQGLARLSVAGAAVGVLALFVTVDPGAPQRSPMLATSLVVIILSALVVGSWRSPESAEAPILPVDPRVARLVEAAVLSVGLFVLGLGLRVVLGLAVGRPVSGALTVRVLALLFPLMLAVAGSRVGRRSLDATLLLPVLLIGGGVAALAPPLTWVVLSALALTAALWWLQPRVERRFAGRRGARPVQPRWTARAGLPAEVRLQLDAGHGIQYRLGPAALWTLLGWGAVVGGAVLSMPRLLFASLIFLPFVPRLYALFCPLDLGVGALAGSAGPAPWALLPVSRDALRRALGRHVLTVLGVGLVLDLVALGVAHAWGFLDLSLAAMGSLFSVGGVALGAITLRRWLNGGVGWLGPALLAAGMLAPALGAAFNLLRGQEWAPMELAAPLLGLAWLGWGVLAWKVRG